VVLTAPLLQKVDAVTVPVPDLDAGLAFYRDRLGHQLRWRNEEVGAAGLALPGSDTEIVLTTRMIAEPEDIPVGRVAVVADPFGNVLVLLDLSKGRYLTDGDGTVTGVTR
jgi:catechol 2,3-dioxygenase-like lactoylglutathione lyase family enzyme